MKWYKVPREEQETVINIDYYDKTITLYTSRYSVGNKLIRYLEPTNIDYFGDKVCGLYFKLNIKDKNVRKLLSKSIVIGQISSVSSKESNEDDNLY